MSSTPQRTYAQHFLHVAAGAQCTLSPTHTLVHSYPKGSARAPVWMADVSHCRRMGFKGPRAAQWLTDQGISIPPQANSWRALGEENWGAIARLGNNEFFLEEDLDAPTLMRLQSATNAVGVYPVLREDSEFLLSGPAADRVLLQICNVDFAALEVAAAPIVMTFMGGVAVLVLPQITGVTRRYRIWCDPSFGPYLWISLAQIVQDCAGSIIGAAQIPNGPRLPGNQT